MVDGWTPGIGDPTDLGWLTVAAYFLAGVLCLRAGRRDRRSAGLWLALAAALFLLGINKQFDLQSLLTAFGRHVALANGWYDERRGVQQEFIIAVLACASAVALAALLVVRRRTTGLKIAALGFVALCGFIVVRATSFHKIDIFLNSRMFDLRWNHLLELGGIAIVALGAALAGARKRPGRSAGHLGKRRGRR